MIRLRRQLQISILLGLLAGAAILLFAACSSGKSGDLAGAYPIPQDPQLIATGLGLYSTNCAHCHGTGTQPPLTSAIPSHGPDGHTWHHPDQMLVSWVLDGVPNGVTMPRYRGQLTEEQVRAVVAYIKTFWTDAERASQRAASVNYAANTP